MKIDADLANQFLDDSSSVKLGEATEITVEGAAILASCRNWPWYGLVLGIKSISPEAARELASVTTNTLDLHGLTSISPEVADAFSSFKGRKISLSGLQELSPEAAKNLSRHRHPDRSELKLGGLKKISVETAYYLGRHRGITDCRGWSVISEEEADSLFRGILESERGRGDQFEIRSILSDEAVLILLQISSYLTLRGGKNNRIENALKAYAQSEATIKPKDTAEIREILAYSNSPQEIEDALKALAELGAEEADWLKVMFSKNTLKRLMKINPDGIDFFSEGLPKQRLPVWQALVNSLGLFPRAKEWFKMEAHIFFDKNVYDHAEDFASGMTEELLPFISEVGELWYSEPEISEEQAALLSRLDCSISFEKLSILTPEVAIALSKHETKLSFDAVTELSDVAAEALSEYKGWLSLDGLTKLSDTAAEALAKREGTLSLYGLETISARAAKFLLSAKEEINTSLDLEEIANG